MSKPTLIIGLLSFFALVGCTPKEEAPASPTTPANSATTAQQTAPNQAIAGSADVRPPMKPGR